jgi:hypothetical protein
VLEDEPEEPAEDPEEPAEDPEEPEEDPEEPESVDNPPESVVPLEEPLVAEPAEALISLFTEPIAALALFP